MPGSTRDDRGLIETNGRGLPEIIYIEPVEDDANALRITAPACRLAIENQRPQEIVMGGGVGPGVPDHAHHGRLGYSG